MFFNLTLGLIFGLCVGSLVDCLSGRSLTTKSFLGRSYCLSCKRTLSWYDLFPVISFLLLRGKCRFCHKSIPKDTIFLEITYGLLVALILAKFVPANFLQLNLGYMTLAIGSVLFKVFTVTILGIVFLTDIREGLIPDRIIKPAILIALVYLILVALLNIYLTHYSITQSLFGKYLLDPKTGYFMRHAFLDTIPLITSIVSALIIGLFFGGLIFITRGRGMGGGDLTLGVFMGLSLGFPASALAIFLSFVLGSIAGVGLIIMNKKKLGQTIPFGPFLSIGGVIALLYGSEIISWYFKYHSF